MASAHNFFTAGLVSLYSLNLAGCLDGHAESSMSAFKQKEMEEAILFLENYLYSLEDVSYASWTPTTAAAEIVTSMNTAVTLPPQEAEEYQQPNVPMREPILYALDQPTDVWQIVLVPDDEQQVIYVRGYGNSLEIPIVEKELSCCSL
jgi:hypothetical protein